MEEVEALFSGDPKTCMTATASISATGGWLPISDRQSRAGRIERRFPSHSEKVIKEGLLTLTHQGTGWTGEEVARAHL
jgi:hypothetical protein